VVDYTFGRILDRHDPEIRPPALHFIEDILDAVDGQILSGFAEFLNASQVGKSRSRSQIGDLLRPFEGQRGRHNFTVHRPDRLIRKWPRILAHEAGDDFGFPPRGVQVGLGVGLFFEFPDFDHALGTFIQEA
jgi:hypothetical protein